MSTSWSWAISGDRFLCNQMLEGQTKHWLKNKPLVKARFSNCQLTRTPVIDWFVLVGPKDSPEIASVPGREMCYSTGVGTQSTMRTLTAGKRALYFLFLLGIWLKILCSWLALNRCRHVTSRFRKTSTNGAGGRLDLQTKWTRLTSV